MQAFSLQCPGLAVPCRAPPSPPMAPMPAQGFELRSSRSGAKRDNHYTIRTRVTTGALQKHILSLCLSGFVCQRAQ
eukprot:7162805-Prymnesium_polylepis.1